VNYWGGGGGDFTGNSESYLKEVSETERPSLRENTEGNLEEGLLYWGQWRICRKGPGEGLVSN